MSENNKELEHLRKEVNRLREEVARLSPSLEMLLKTRGFYIYKKSPPSEIPLLPEDKHIDEYYELLRRYSFRIFLRDVIKYQDRFAVEDVVHYATEEVTADYLKILQDMGLIEKLNNQYRITKRPIRSFGPTLEWFVAEIFKREYRTEAIWSVRFKRSKVGGDYDVITKLDSRILYIEVKSSPPKQIYQSEISAFYDRVNDLSPEIAIFLMDTELRMKDKIVPMFEEELNGRGLESEVMRIEQELFHINNRVFIINSKRTIEGNIEKVIRWYFLYNR